MKSLNKYWFIAIIALVCVIALTVSAPRASAAGDRYGYTQLSTQAQRDVYLALAEGIKNRSDKIEIPFTGLGTDLDTEIMPQLSVIVPLLQCDYPEYFWFTGGFGVSGMSNGSALVECYVEPAYQLNGQTVSGSALASAVATFDAKVAQIIAGMPSGLDQYGKALYLHDYVAGAVSYEQVGDHQSAYGALVGGQAVCAGYATAYQCLLNAAGIDAWRVDGVSANPANGQVIPHSWNLVWLDGECYYTDVTWDDQGEYLFHSYLNLSLNAMTSLRHTPEHPEYLPSCDHSKMNYYNKESGDGTGVGIITDSTTAETAAVYFKAISNGTQYKCSIRFEGSDFNAWANANFSKIMEILGVSYHNEVFSNGNGYIITLGEAGVSTEASQITLSETSKTLDVGDAFKLSWTIKPDNAAGHAVTFTSSAPSVASVDSNGNVTAKSSGTAVITAAVDGKTAKCEVSVRAKTNSEHKDNSKLSYIPAKDPTCTEEGYGAYYACSCCGKYFADKDAKTEIKSLESLRVAAKGHTPSDWKYSDTHHYKNCTVDTCKVQIDGSNGVHEDSNGDQQCDVCKYAMSADATTPTTNGNVTTEPTDAATQPTTKPADTQEPTTQPSIDATTESNEDTAAPTVETTIPGYNGAETDTSSDIWIYIVAGVLAAGAGIGAFIVIRKRNM